MDSAIDSSRSTSLTGVSYTRRLTVLMNHLSQGRTRAMTWVYKTFFNRMSRYADRSLQRRGQIGILDGEDIAQDALIQFTRRIKLGQLAIANHAELHAQLKALTRQAAIDANRKEGAEKRGGKANVISHDAVADQNGGEGLAILSRDLDPAVKAAAKDRIEFWMDHLAHKRQEYPLIALLKSHGYTNQAIARAMDFSESKVDRSVRDIAATLRELNESESEQINRLFKKDDAPRATA